jgi:phage shock protein PspC (stress-responsive transcriptional regulator)/uncharacterized protein YjeT (DUF2065 family)
MNIFAEHDTPRQDQELMHAERKTQLEQVSKLEQSLEQEHQQIRQLSDYGLPLVGLALVVIGLLTILTGMPGFGGPLFGDLHSTLRIIGVLLLGVGGGIVIKILRHRPVDKLWNTIRKVREHVAKPFKQATGRIKTQAHQAQQSVARHKPRKRDKVFLGVAAYIGRKMGIAPNLVRFGLIALTFATGGTSIALYFILGIILHVNTPDEVD